MSAIKSRMLDRKENACPKRRARSAILVEEGKNQPNNNYVKAVAIKTAIEQALKSGWTDASLEASIQKGFEEIEYPTELTKEIHVKDAFIQCKRYLQAENRRPVMLPKRTVNCFGLEVEVSSIMLFSGMKSFTYTVGTGAKKVSFEKCEPYLEIAKLKTSKPTVTQKGRKNGVNTCMELYAMLKYCREILARTAYASEPIVHLGASYYFLRKDTDNFKENTFDMDFFKGGGNVVSLWETHTGSAYGEPEAMDQQFQPQFEEFINGKECSKEDCERCEWNAACNYNKPPIVLDVKPKAKSLSDIMLSENQEEAINFRKGVARILAGAGAGKTLVVALRIAYLLDEGVRPEDILLLTFTNTGAKEMLERIKLYTEDLGCDADLSKLTCTTFNAFGYAVVKEHYEELGFTAPPRLIDEIERAKIVDGLLKTHAVRGLDWRNYYMSNKYVKGALPFTIACFNAIKANQLGPGCEKQLAEAISNMTGSRNISTLTDELALYAEYDAILREKNLIEFADQENLLLEYIGQNPYVFEDRPYRHITVDEFQDTNEKQMLILKHIMDTPAFESLLVVGDDSQGIFGFRGASTLTIVQFPRYISATIPEMERMVEGEMKIQDIELALGAVKDIYLVENHRSTPEIIGFANALNAMNVNRVEKDLVATRPSGEPVHVRQFWAKKDEYAYIAERIKAVHETGVDYEDMAFIAYKNSELLAMGTVLTEQGIPFILLNPEKLKDNSKVNAAISLAKFTRDPSATKDAFIYLNAVSGNTLLDENPDETVNQMITDLREEILDGEMEDFKNRVEELDAGDDEIFTGFKDSLFEKPSVTDMIDWCLDFEKFGDNEKKRRMLKYPGVVLTTAHSAKGMEWNVVFNSISSYQHSLRMDRTEQEEIRRLFFVSATRARDILYVTGQTVAGKIDDMPVCSFLVQDAYKAAGEKEQWTMVNPNKKEKKKAS